MSNKGPRLTATKLLPQLDKLVKAKNKNTEFIYQLDSAMQLILKDPQVSQIYKAHHNSTLNWICIFLVKEETDNTIYHLYSNWPILFFFGN